LFEHFSVNFVFFVLQADGIYDNPLDLLDIKPEFSDEETLNDSKTETKVKGSNFYLSV